MLRSFITNRNLILQLTKRDILSKYKGSFLGILWSILTPLFMLVIYTLVFGEIFQSKWNRTASESTFMFGLVLFTGMIVYNIFSEVLSRSTSIIQSNVNYVKKIIFPLEVLPVVLMLTSLFNGLISLVILLIMSLCLGVSLTWTMLLIPVILLPLILMSTGLAWFLASIGVFFKDTNYLITILLQVVLFLSPIFYPADIVPDYLSTFYKFNPLGLIIEQLRQILLWGELPNWNDWLLVMVISLILFITGFYFFRRLKGAFADVI